jgi:Domain of unknown function (DUF4286)
MLVGQNKYLFLKKRKSILKTLKRNMILYNVTINIEDSVHEEWLEWMKSKHVPDVLATGLFLDSKIFKIKSGSEGKTYSIQYFLNSMDDYERYQTEFASKLQKEHTEKYGDKFVAFRTIMEQVD